MDFRKALTFVFEDKGWLKKVLIGIVLTMLSFLILPLVFVTGYEVEVAEKTISGKRGLPKWNKWRDKFIKGVAVAVAEFLYLLPLVAIYSVFSILFIGAVAKLEMMEDWLTPLFVAVSGIYIIAFFLITPVIIAQYANTGSFEEMFKLKKIFRIIRSNLGGVLVVVIVGLVGISLNEAALFAVRQLKYSTIVRIVLSSIFPGFYWALVTFNLIGQLAERIKQSESPKA